MLRFRVPASTTNLGHGFDCLGLALGASNTIAVTEIDGDGVRTPNSQDKGLAVMAEQVRAACRLAWKTPIPGITVAITGDVPIARGMGSSATILLGVAAACQALIGREFHRAELIPIAAALEGHPDNVTAACFGGFTVVGHAPGGMRYARINAPAELLAVVAIPPFEVRTSEARQILPEAMTRKDAVTALQRTALITAAFALNRPDDLRGLFDDAWHEFHRSDLNPGLVEARTAAAEAGALGTILSGSGSSVLSFCTMDKAVDVQAAVLASYTSRGVSAQVRTLPFDNDGLVKLDQIKLNPGAPPSEALEPKR